MPRSAKPARSKTRGKRFDPSDLFALTDPERRGLFYTLVGVVFAPESESHFELVSEDGVITDVLVQVETQPDQMDITCRLGSVVSGPQIGIWAIPPVGTEVAVLVPNGRTDFMPTIVATLSSGRLPVSNLSENETVIAGLGTTEVTANTEIIISAPKIILGDPSAVSDTLDGVVQGRNIEPFTGSPYNVLGVSTVVFAQNS